MKRSKLTENQKYYLALVPDTMKGFPMNAKLFVGKLLQVHYATGEPKYIYLGDTEIYRDTGLDWKQVKLSRTLLVAKKLIYWVKGTYGVASHYILLFDENGEVKKLDNSLVEEVNNVFASKVKNNNNLEAKNEEKVGITYNLLHITNNSNVLPLTNNSKQITSNSGTLLTSNLEQITNNNKQITSNLELLNPNNNDNSTTDNSGEVDDGFEFYHKHSYDVDTASSIEELERIREEIEEDRIEMKPNPNGKHTKLLEKIFKKRKEELSNQTPIEEETYEEKTIRREELADRRLAERVAKGSAFGEAMVG